MNLQDTAGPQATLISGGGRVAPIVVLIPLYNDWEACGILVGRLDEELAAAGRDAVVLLVDDCSSAPREAFRLSVPLRAIRAVDVLVLRRNLGHQRAICTGLSHVEREYTCDAVVVMDGDGEDDPGDVPRLLDRWEARNRESVVFAERTRRSEGMAFRLSYWCYRVLHRALTGLPVRVGNFSVLPRRHLRSLVAVSELWSHYAAAVFVARMPYTTVPTRRAKRIAGTSSMSYVSLVTHGLSAISVFSEVVSVRVLLAAACVAGGTSAGIIAVVGIRLFTPWTVPGWATYTSGILMIILLLTIMFALLFTFSVLFSRKSAAMLPIRDYGYFVDRVYTVHSSVEVRNAALERPHVLL